MKIAYTKIFLKQANIAVSDASVKIHLHKWWQNTRDKNKGGLRLTEDGFDFLTNSLDIHFYPVPLPFDYKLNTQTIIWLDQFIECPYYLNNKNIFVTEEKKAIELHLFSGDLQKYGANKAMERYE